MRGAGITLHQTNRSIAEGRLRRVRRSWLVSSGCDERRVAAASVGGRVTCASAAALRGWWAVETDAVHVALPHSASRFESAGVRVHRAAGPVPTRRFSVEEHPLNVLFHVARCLPRANAVAIWESAIRAGAVDLDELERVRWRSSAAAELSAFVGGRSDSGPESTFAVLMREIGVPVKQQFWVDGHPLDAMIGDRLGVQIDGFRHHSAAADRRRDIRADARLALRGYTVLRFDYQQIMHDGRYVQHTILTALAQGLHLARGTTDRSR